MVKKITKVGNSHALILDTTLMGLLRLKAGDEVNVEVHPSRTLTLTPVVEDIDEATASATARRLIGRNSELFRRLS